MVTISVYCLFSILQLFQPVDTLDSSKINVLKNKPPINLNENVTAPLLDYDLIKSYPHDTSAFTQGLVYHEGYLYEGTGLRGKSSIRKINLKTGNSEKSFKLPKKYFGEGITILKDKIYQLTWKSNIGFVYDLKSFDLINEFYYPFEGWGITTDGKELILSDGSSSLYFMDPETFGIRKKLQVFDRKTPIKRINELEFIDGNIYANVWITNKIAVISPQSGKVLYWIDLRGLLKKESNTQRVDVMNGIAYDNVSKRIFVTGKLWPKIFEIKINSEVN